MKYKYLYKENPVSTVYLCHCFFEGGAMMLLKQNSNPADTGSLPHCRKKKTEVTLGKSYTRGFTIRDSVQAIHKACPVSSNSFPRKKFPSLEPRRTPVGDADKTWTVNNGTGGIRTCIQKRKRTLQYAVS